MRPIILLILMAASGLAQSDYQKHYFTFGAGAGIPKGDLDPVFRTRPAIRVGYGYRFFRFAQLDVGFDTVFQAADVNRLVDVGFTYAKVRDFEFMVPFGGRAILPLAGERVLLYGGGGGTWLTYSELLRQPIEYYRLECYDCSSKSGWGYYATAGGSVALDQGQHFRLGGGLRMYRADTSGYLPVPELYAGKTRDKWYNIYAEFTFSF